MALRVRVAGAVLLALLGTQAWAASPFPAGYDVAYSAYVAALPLAARHAKWLAKLEGVASQPQSLKMSGQSVIYLFACKEHSCDANNTNVFLLPDRKTFKAVIKIAGVRTLLGGAGLKEVQCVAKIDASDGVATAC